MILVLANSRDLQARRLVEAWRAHDARLLTLADLSRTGWRHYLGEVGPEIAVASGELIPAASIDGVITRIPWVAPEDLLHVVYGDRDYVAAEISAFLIAWLTQLTCPVINRPATNSLMGAPHAAEGWVAIAARAGLRLPWTRRVFPAPPEPAWPPEAITVSILGDRCFGDVDPALADQACRLAAAANVELLAVTFSHAAADATFLGAHLWPDVSLPELASALLARFVPAAARPAGIAAEAGA
jgi:hypothetical protein